MFFLQIILNSIVTGTTVLLLAAGLYLINLVGKVYHIALAGIMISGAYAYYEASQLGAGGFFSFIAGLIVAALLGIFSYYLLAGMIKQKLYMPALLVSIAFWLAIKSLLAIIFGSEGRFLINGVLKTFAFSGLYITEVGLYAIILGLLIALISWFILTYLPGGRMLKAVIQHGECASLLKIKVKKVQLTIFVIASLVAGFIGILNGMNTAITPASGTELIIMAFAANIVGGVNDFRGIVLSSYLLVLIPEFLSSISYFGYSFSSSWKLVLFFVLALILLLIRPQGLFTQTLRKS